MNSATEMLYDAYWRIYLTNIFRNKFPVDFQPTGSSRWFEVFNNMADDPDSHWWDSQFINDYGETRKDILKPSFARKFQI